MGAKIRLNRILSEPISSHHLSWAWPVPVFPQVETGYIFIFPIRLERKKINFLNIGGVGGGCMLAAAGSSKNILSLPY